MKSLSEAEARLEERASQTVSLEMAERDRAIVRTSIVGIVANIALAGFKASVGLLTRSIAIVMDAVNNLSDALSSIITIVGIKLASKEPDKEHPFGYGRIEYLSAMVIALIVLYAGITSFVESVKAIFHPEVPNYTMPSLVIVGAGVVVKIALGRYVKAQGERYHSDSLINSGADATLDAIISLSTLVAAIVYLLSGLSFEAWLGAAISVVIIKSGIEMLQETLSQILGERADAGLALAITKTVCSFDEVLGAYDLVLNNYGPDRYNGSIHIELPDTYRVSQLDELIRSIQYQVYVDHHVILTAVGVYSVNTSDPQVIAMREHVRELVMGVDNVLQMHGFYLDERKGTMRFDVVVSFDAPDRRATFDQAVQAVQKAYPSYQIQAAMDSDFSVL